MRFAAFLIALIAVPAFGQIQSSPARPAPVAAKPATGTIPGERPTIALETVADLEVKMKDTIIISGGTSPFVLIGLPRGVYVSGIGAIYTCEIELSPTPTPLFQTTINPDQKAQTHQRKTAQLPRWMQVMKDLTKMTATSLASMPDSEQVIVSARLVYRAWEDTSGLPGQIVMRADRRSALNGDVKTTVQ